MERNEAWDVIHHERAALADVLDTLSPQEWATPSLCEGWAVRDVAAHVISSPQSGLAQVLPAILRARGSFDRMVYVEAKRAAARPVAEIVGDYRRLASSRRHPPGTTYREPLLDVLVHTQDIVVPLGRSHAMPVEAARVAAEQVWRRSFPFHARRRLGHVHLVATDVAWDVGHGPAVQGPIQSLLLLLTGRRVALPGLTGAGVGVLAR